MPEPKGRPMKKHLIWMTAVFALVAAACGSDDGGGNTSAPTDPRGQQLVAMLQADSDFPVSDAEANCTANNMIANLDDSTIDAMLDDEDIDMAELPNPEDGLKALDAMFDCVDVEQMMVDQMVADGSSEEEARCIAQEFGEDEIRGFMEMAALPEDQVDESAAFEIVGQMFEVMATCGVSLDG